MVLLGPNAGAIAGKVEAYAPIPKYRFASHPRCPAIGKVSINSTGRGRLSPPSFDKKKNAPPRLAWWPTPASRRRCRNACGTTCKLRASPSAGSSFPRPPWRAPPASSRPRLTATSPPLSPQARLPQPARDCQLSPASCRRTLRVQSARLPAGSIRSRELSPSSTTSSATRHSVRSSRRSLAGRPWWPLALTAAVSCATRRVPTSRGIRTTLSSGCSTCSRSRSRCGFSPRGRPLCPWTMPTARSSSAL